MIISGKKLLEILEEFKNSNPKKEERIPYEEWRNLVKFLTKSINDKLSAEPIKMLGGSPIKVAVPPIFDAKISRIK